MGVTHNLILGGGTSLPTTLNVTVSGGTATSVTATLGSRSVSLAYDSTSALWSATLPKNATGNWTVTATDGSKTVSDLVAISGPGIWSMELALRSLPSGYTEIEYLQNTASAYINTQIIPGSIDDIAIETTINIQNWGGYSDGSAYAHWFGCSVNGQGYNFYCCAASYTSGNGIGGFAETFGSYTLLGLTLNANAGIVVSCKSGTQTATVDGVVKGSTSYSFVPVNVPFYLFRMTSAESVFVKAKIGKTKLWYNSALVRNFIPARRNSDSVLGMYDLVNDVFYTNAGSGSFIAGPDA